MLLNEMNADMNVINIHTKEIFWGSIVLIVCLGFYLAWWILAFRPEGAAPHSRTVPLLALAAAAGAVSVALQMFGISKLPHEVTMFPGKVILWGGVLLYVVLLIVTSVIFHRQATSELLLIIGWAMLELSAVDALYGTGQFTHITAVILCLVVAAAVVISMICYMLYYHMEAVPGYHMAMVPLITEAVVMAVFSITIIAALRG